MVCLQYPYLCCVSQVLCITLAFFSVSQYTVAGLRDQDAVGMLKGSDDFVADAFPHQ